MARFATSIVIMALFAATFAAPPPQIPPAGPVVIEETGASEAVGYGGSVVEHSTVMNITGDDTVPALISFSVYGNAGLDQNAYNYQQTQINADGSSAAYQSNSASNSGYASDSLYGEAQGLEVDVISSGWSAVEGEGAVGQVDVLDHTGSAVVPPPSGSGWRKP